MMPASPLLFWLGKKVGWELKWLWYNGGMRRFIAKIYRRVMFGLAIVVFFGATLWGGGTTLAVERKGSAKARINVDATLTLSLSSAMLNIANLTPTVADDSNEITVTVSTNNQAGYKLYATVGDAVYNTRDLKYDGAGVGDKFSSLGVGEEVTAITADNTWGYSITHGKNGGAGARYKGLPLYTEPNPAELKSSTSPVTDQLPLLIGAKAGITQRAGDYKNVITLRAVTNRMSMSLADGYVAAGKHKVNNPDDGQKYYKMQDMEPAICEVADIESTLKVLDTRDNKVYWIAKLKMNREGTEATCWMTQNLDFDLNVATTLTPDNTDIPAPWTPATSTSTMATFAPNDWQYSDDNYKYPRSYDDGDKYIYPTATVPGDPDTIYGSLVDCTSAGHTADDCLHYKNGNYYNWTAAVAVNDSSVYAPPLGIFAPSQNVDQSICPKGWRLPTNTSKKLGGTPVEWRPYGGDIRDLWQAYDILGNGDDYEFNYSAAGFNNIRNTPMFLARSGMIRGGSGLQLEGVGEGGAFWHSVATALLSHASSAFFSTNLTPHHYIGAQRNEGLSLRCLAR